MRMTLLEPGGDVGSPITREPGLRELLSRAARHGIPLLLVGPEGIGKRWLARSVHGLSGSAGPMVVVDREDADLEMSDAEATERLTDAVEAARSGTLLIQDLGLLPQRCQALLATALDGSLTISLRGLSMVEPVRALGCLDGDLADAVRRGRLRRDLADRFLPVEVPPLQARRADIPLLLRHAVQRRAEASGRPVPMVTRETVDRLLDHGWPTRLDQIEQFAESAVAVGSAEAAVSMLELQSWPGTSAPQDPEAEEPGAAAREALGRGESIELEEVRREVMRRAERRWLNHVLEATAGDRRRAATLLGLDHEALLAKMREHGLRGSRP